jgi:hypothetical protein
MARVTELYNPPSDTDEEAFEAAWNSPEEHSRLNLAFSKICDAFPPITGEMQTYRRGDAEAGD